GDVKREMFVEWIGGFGVVAAGIGVLHPQAPTLLVQHTGAFAKAVVMLVSAPFQIMINRASGTVVSISTVSNIADDVLPIRRSPFHPRIVQVNGEFERFSFDGDFVIVS